MDNLSIGHELDYFAELWSQRSDGPVDHSSEIWDRRAERWIANLEAEPGKTARKQRIRTMAGQLRSRGLLSGNQMVADIGCGPGMFALEFARTARHVVGFDYSGRFVEHAKTLALQRNVSNVEFLQRDFLTLDIEQGNFAGAFDLVFASLTPAATGKGCLEKMMNMSRGFCCSVSIVYAQDSLAERVMRDVYGETLRTRWDGRGFYTLMNLLWLSGYYPEVSYYDDVRDEVILPGRHWAKKIAAYCGKRSEEDIHRIGMYLTQNGELSRHSSSRYGMLLWDATRRDVR